MASARADSYAHGTEGWVSVARRVAWRHSKPMLANLKGLSGDFDSSKCEEAKQF